MNKQSISWDDLRVILAISRAGSLSGASRRLLVSHATVYRRLGEAERRLGVRLFERIRSGYLSTPAGEEVVAAAARVESEVLGVERRVIGRDLRPSGTVRITTTDSLLLGLLSPIFTAFRRAQPEISLEVSISDVLASLSRREADVAIRVTRRPPDHLVGRRIGTVAQAAYVCRDGLCESAPPPRIDSLPWVGPDQDWSYPQLQTWMAAHGHDDRCHYRADTLVGMYAAVRDGLGAGILPCYLGDDEQRIVRITNPIPELTTDLWLLTHPDLRRVARIRALTDFVRKSVHARQDRLAG